MPVIRPNINAYIVQINITAKNLYFRVKCIFYQFICLGSSINFAFNIPVF
jgi:hypothetical protein